ncbi:MAG TPA: TIGR04211 family SH3 domain-containing protein [Gammaproteobacteria bacterium]|nr:TIGR04211 family SH3 domain-containing protein [Gammaproteobacteria bacterium]
MRGLLYALLLLAAARTAGAETAYVTDMLRLGIASSPGGSAPPFDTLSSGDALEVLERSGSYAHVRLSDGRDGWVKAAFIVTEKPARLRIAEAEAAVSSMREEMGQSNAAREKAEQELARYKADESSGVKAAEQLAEARRQNELYQSRLDRYRHSLPLPWVAGAMLIALVAGFVGGWWWLDALIRRRYGGFRIY